MDRFQRFERFRRVDRKNAFMVFFIIIFALILLILLFRLNSAWNLKQYRVLVTHTNLTRGMRISPGDIEWKTYPKDQITPLYFTQNNTASKDVVGGVVVHDIPSGEAI